MKTKALIILLVSFLTFLQSQVKCGLQDVHDSLELARIDRPINQTYYESSSGIFYVHYDTTAVPPYDHRPLEGDDNQNNVPDYVEWVAIMADSAQHVLVDILGYDPHPYDSDGKYDIYLRDDMNPSYYGVTYYDASLNNGSSWIEIENDFSPEENFNTVGYDAMKVTMVHEYFHGIQFGYSAYTSYNSNSNVWFYEMSSTWLEDLLVPEVNDYLSLRFNYFNDPTRSIDDTNGYSIALFCHYLSTNVEGVQNEYNSHILNQIWTNFSNASHHIALTSMKNIMNTNFGTLFVDAWIHWVTLNLYNGIHEDYYYHADQSLIGPINTSPVSLINSTSFDSLRTDTYSAGINSYRVVHSNVGIELQFDGVYYTGYIAVVSSDPERNVIYPVETLMDVGILNDGDEIHIILGNTVQNNNYVDGEIRLLFTPYAPGNLIGIAVQDSIKLVWDSVVGPGDIYDYLVNRMEISEDGLEIAPQSFTVWDTVFYDNSISPNQTYSYTVSARNYAGYSALSDPVYITSWPAASEVSALKIVTVYPNPISQNSGGPIYLEIDCNRDFASLDLQLINILGQRVYQNSLPTYPKGRHRIQIAGSEISQRSSGIYFVRIRDDHQKIVERKIHIIK